MRKVLIVGGAGFVGSHLCDELIAHGYDVRVLDNLDPQVHGGQYNDLRKPKYLDSAVEFIQGDIRNQWAVQKALAGVDAVIHLAAKVGVAQSAYEMIGYVHNNSTGTACLLQEMQGTKFDKLIVAGSMSVCGEGDYGPDSEPIPTKESSPPDLQSIYALTKYDQEQMCLLFGRTYKVPTIALRFFNVYGTRQSLNNPYTGAMAIFASRLLNGKPPIIYEDGQQRRDFVNVKDVARAVRLALESDVSDEVINIGSGESQTILHVAQCLCAALSSELVPEITGQHRVGDIRHCFADISKAQRLLGYEPQVRFEDGYRELVEWLRTQTAIDHVEKHRAELVEKGLLA